MNITQAHPEEAPVIAQLIMQAMTDECCQNLAGADHTLHDFHAMMTLLVSMDDSQYSYRNTLVARTPEGHVAGICVSYPGADLHRLRRRFIEQAQRLLGQDFTDMPDETTEGELYIDSLAVFPQYRGQGIATTLLHSTIEKAETMSLPAGLLVDKGNPKAERLHNKVGFRFVNDTTWAGHEMKHLQK